MSLLRYDAGDGVAVALHVRQEGFGGAEVEVHVQADGEVVVVVGDEEGDDFFLFFRLAHVLYEGEDQAAVGDAVVGFDVLDAAVYQRLLLDAAAGGHGEVYFVAHLEVGGLPRAGLAEDAEHVEDAAAVFVLHFLRLAVGGFVPRAALLDVGGAVAVGEPGFVLGVAFAFLGGLAEVLGFQLVGDVADEGVAHLEEEVGALAGV